MLLEIEARLDAGIVLVADDDQRRQAYPADLILQLVERRAAALEAALGVGGALRVVLCEGVVKLLKTARVLYQKRDPPRGHAGNPCDDVGVALLEFFGMRHA